MEADPEQHMVPNADELRFEVLTRGVAEPQHPDGVRWSAGQGRRQPRTVDTIVDRAKEFRVQSDDRTGSDDRTPPGGHGQVALGYHPRVETL